MATIELDLEFHDKHIAMPVRVMEAVASLDDTPADLPPVPEAEADEVHIDPLALFDRTSLDDFFRQECRTVPDGGRVRAFVYEGDDNRLLHLLEVTGPTDKPIPVKVPRG